MTRAWRSKKKKKNIRKSNNFHLAVFNYFGKSLSSQIRFLSQTSQKLPENKPICQNATLPQLPTILICKVNKGSHPVWRGFVSFYTKLCLPAILKTCLNGRRRERRQKAMHLQQAKKKVNYQCL